MGILGVAVLSVAGVLLAIQFKSGKSEYGVYISLALSLFIFAAVLSQLKVMLQAFRSISAYIEVDKGFLEVLIKMVGITYMSELASGFCKDAGYQAIATQVEMFGKVLILILSLPVLSALLSTIREFLP